MTLKSGYVVEDYDGTYLVLRGIPAREGNPVESEDVPYIKLTLGKQNVLEYIYVPERMRGHKLSQSLLELLFEYMDANEISFFVFECICRPFWCKARMRFPKRIYFPPSVLHRTNVGVIKIPCLRHSDIKIRKL